MADCAHFVNADLSAAGLSPLAPERELIAASRIFLNEIEDGIKHQGMKITQRTTSPEEGQVILGSLQKAVTQALERKHRLGQYAVVWRDGKPVMIGEDASKESENSVS